MATLASLSKRLRETFNNSLVKAQKAYENPTRIKTPRFDETKMRSIPLNAASGFAESLINEPVSIVKDVGTGVGKAITGDLNNFNPTSNTMRLTNNVIDSISTRQNPFSTVKLSGYGKGKWNVPFTSTNLPEMGFSESPAAGMAKQAIGVLEPFMAVKGAIKPLAVAGYIALGSGANALLGDRKDSLEQRLIKGANTAAPDAAVSAGFLTKTNPFLDKIGGKAITRLPLKSGANVAQGVGLNELTGQENSGASVLLDALFPLAGELMTKTFKSSQEAVRATEARLKSVLGKSIRNNKGMYTTVEKFAKGTRPYRKSGKYAQGGLLGFEPYQDEDGSWKVRFNRERALLGLGLGIGMTKSVTSGNLKDLEDSLNRTKIGKSIDSSIRGKVLEEAERMLAGGIGDTGRVGDSQVRYSANPDWYRDFYKQTGRAPSNEEFFEMALSRANPKNSFNNVDDVLKALDDAEKELKGVDGKQIDPLIEEARKYKSAEEFVKAKTYTSNKADIEEFFKRDGDGHLFNSATVKANKKINKDGTIELVHLTTPEGKLGIEKEGFKEGTWFGLHNNRAISRPGSAPTVTMKIKVDPSDMAFGRYALNRSKLVKGADGVYRPEKVSQLTDIWNKANQPINSPYSMGIVGNSPTKTTQLPRQESGVLTPKKDMQISDPNRTSLSNILALPGKSTGVAGENFTIQDLKQPITRKEGVKLSKSLIKQDARITATNEAKRKSRALKDAADVIARSIKDNTDSVIKKEVQATGGMISRSDGWKDKAKLLLKRETMERNFEDIMGGDAPQMKRVYIEPIKTSEAERIRFLNKERAEIGALGIKSGSDESKWLQMYGEAKDKATAEMQLKKALPNSWQKVVKAEKIFRQKYDTYLEEINKALTRNGYDPIPRRSDYFRHFNEIGSVLEMFGIPVKDDLIPTDIVGMTAGFKPGKNFFASALPRLGNKTEIDAIRGIDKYLDGASNQIYHTDNIQRLRGLEKSLRDYHAGTGQLSNFVAELGEYTNKLAGKKSMIDRSLEDLVGRKIYGVMNGLKRQTGSNMIGFNLSSALTNFIPFTQSLATTSKDAAVRGMAQAMQNTFRDDGFVSRSSFLTRRFGSKPLHMTKWEKAQDTGFVFMKIFDRFVSESIVRGKYIEGIQKGLSKSDAMSQADNYAGRLLGDRSKGMMPTIFESQALGPLTQFQLEMNNQLSFMFKDIPHMYDKKGAAFALAQVFVYSYLFNEGFKQVTGREPAFDPIGLAIDTVEDFTDEETTNKQATKNLAGSISNQLPFVSMMTGGRIPMADVLPNPLSVMSGDSTVKKEASDAFFGVVPPTGGNQLRKSLQGLDAYNRGYSKSQSGRARFPIPQTGTNLAKTALFGQYSTPEARDYFRKGRTVLGEKQTQGLQEATDKTGFYNVILGERKEGRQDDIVRARVEQTGQEEMSNGKLFYMGNETDGKTGEVKKVVKSLDVSDIEQTNAETGLGKYIVDNEAGNKKVIDLSKPLKRPDSTGLKELDKELIRTFNDKISTRINNIRDVYNSGQITAEEAEKAINDLLEQKIATGKAKKKGVSVSMPKITFAKADAISKTNIKPSTFKLKKAPKLKLSSAPTRKATIKLAKKSYAKGKPIKFKNTLSESLTKLV